MEIAKEGPKTPRAANLSKLVRGSQLPRPLHVASRIAVEERSEPLADATFDYEEQAYTIKTGSMCV